MDKNREGHFRNSEAAGDNTEPEMLSGALSKEQFSEIANYKGEICITVYTHKPESLAGNKGHFKNQLGELRLMLQDRELEAGDITRCLQNAEQLLRNEEFWTVHQSSQLAFFMSEGIFQCIELNGETLAKGVVDNSFNVAPLLPQLKDDNYFFINVVSKKGCKLFRADKEGIQAVPVLVGSEAEDENASGKSASNSKGSESGSLIGSSQGSSDGNQDDKSATAVFFETIDDVLWKEVLKNEHVPMVLAGVESVLPIYRSVSDYKFIWDEYLTGSREQQEATELYADAMKIMKPYFDIKLNRALEDYGNQSGTEKTSSVVADIIPAAYYARISHLFVLKGEFVWGLFNQDTNTLELYHSHDEGGEDLVDNAVVKTLSNGGSVFLLEKEQMPADSQMAAIFRY